ncbi:MULTISPECIES: aminoacyl-tRNA hydrolase [unclassified Arcicella]|uniref:aminoacyl-tRNA hydrolase n=1 Tax=unclassified Arcicella TaxID=2644986 RepID=UPI002867AB07|nr:MULTISPECIES: aminoacyl-tRNA hydrolase [unclassified Arcicella]MDR6564772.1 PTH1 family peptidyl-tRNA hydrolase [Arcicella sp. BE51]MDR6814568.1 PTH1 family peptidyl-tRNA hydrolase [Arcicella sp. BE140]MDR6825946.1 PTH1 family peptidyl-tRNA hydrolase [Arcicella sp. BE139]
MKYLIVGLGNIGPEYLLTRHNVGFMVLDKLAASVDAKFSMERLAYHTEIKHKGKQIHLIKPTTYMNLSGKAVNYWMKELKIEKENILIITDDIALPYGKLRTKSKGSHGGHNGLRNIEEVLGSSQYGRLRFGVGDDFGKGRQVEYVLGKFDGSQFAELPEHLDRAIDIIFSFCLQGIDKTMNSFNQ